MGYGVTAYRVKLKALATMFNSDDKAVRREATRAALAKHCKNEEIVKELVEEGKASNSGLAHEYYYAIEGMMGMIGVPMYARHWSPVDVNTFGQLEEEFQNFGDLFPFDLPEPDDFPWVLALPYTAMTIEVANKLEAKLNDKQLFDELNHWIEEAKKEERDLVLYFY